MWFDYSKEQAEKPISEYELIKQGRFSISSSLWNELVARFSKEEIIAHFTSLIETLEFPFRIYSEIEVKEDWLSLLTEPSILRHGEWVSDRIQGISDLTYLGSPLYLKGSNRGLKVSDQYTQPARMACGHERYKSPLNQWTRAPFKDKTRYLLNPLFSIMKDVCAQRGFGDDEIFNCLRLYSFMASQFKPSVAKSLYDFFGAKRVLDFSAGWGDRLVGFLASGAESYVGIDPNTQLHEPYQKIVDWVSPNKKVQMVCQPAEDVNFSDYTYDFVFTSPPYFDTERYSEEPTQSWKRYEGEQAWLEGFLLNTLRRAWVHLEEGGRMAINISDVFSTQVEGSYKIVCKPMLEYMENLGATYEGVIGYPLSKLPGTKLKQEAQLLCEPIFVWSKGRAVKPSWDHSDYFFEV
jgi:16S rRNA G966 N2-methylase RsmD